LFRLTARFDVDLQGHFLFKRPMTDDLCYRTELNDFDVEICLNPDVQSWRDREKMGITGISDDDFYWSTSKVRIHASRNEDEAPPRIQMANGKHSYEGNSKYFDDRKKDYQEAAWEILNRTVIFFKYRLYNPNLLAVVPKGKAFHNPIWLDENGKQFSWSAWMGILTPLPSLERFSVRSLSRFEDMDLVNALKNPISLDLTEQLLSDAQAAIFQDNLRRAVLEIAIACETTVKQAFFDKATLAGAAFEYLEDKGKVRITVKEMIDSVAKQTFGKSFREDNRSHYDNIDFIFRCRNKAAHRGELTYRDDSGVMHSVNNDTLAGWWDSVMALIDWLNANKSA